MSPPTSNEQLIGVADANLRVLNAERRLARFVGSDVALHGGSLLEALPEASRRALMLVARRVAREVVIGTDGATAELVARAALVGEETWVLLLERAPKGARYVPLSTTPFVGRHAELTELDRYLADPGASVLFVHGPLGIGKSALLKAFAARCDELGCPYFSIDANTHPPSDDLIARILTRGTAEANPFERLIDATRALGPGRWVLFIDNFDAWQALAGTARVRPCAHLPMDCRIVVAARRMPAPCWWEATPRTPHTMPLGPLSLSEGVELASKLGMSGEQSQELARRAAGHPLSLVALASGMRTQASLWHAAPSRDLERIGAGRWEILEAASIPARITEDVLSTLLDNADVMEAFDLLTNITVRDPSGIGLRMPLVVREAIKSRLRERNPARLSELQRRLATHLGTLLDSGTASHLVPVADDFFDALEDRVVIRRIAGSRDDGLPSTRRMRGEDDRSMLASAAREIGGASAAEAILRRVDRGFVVTCVAEGPGGIEAICQYVTLTVAARATLSEMRDDGELGAALEVLRQRTLLAPDEYVIACLAWVARDVREGAWGPPSQALFRTLFSVILTAPRPAATIFVLPDSEFPLGTRELPSGDVPVSVGAYSVLYRDLRGLTARNVLSAISQADDECVPRITAVTRPEAQISTEAIREALLLVDQPERLVGGALTSLRLVEEEAGPGAAPSERAVALARVLRSTVVALGGGQRESRQREVLEAVFFGKGGKHEKIAAELGMPYSTFRRHLARGIDRLAEMIRAREQSARRAVDEQR